VPIGHGRIPDDALRIDHEGPATDGSVAREDAEGVAELARPVRDDRIEDTGERELRVERSLEALEAVGAGSEHDGVLGLELRIEAGQLAQLGDDVAGIEEHDPGAAKLRE
jgi:hypothetical protein